MITEYKNCELSDIKVIIFDFDETLYYAPDILKYSLEYKKQALIDMGGYTGAEASALLNKYGYTLTNKHAEAFGNNMKNFGIANETWDKYKITNIFLPPKEVVSTLDNGLLAKLAEKFRLYIASRDMYENIVKKSAEYDIDLNNFNAIKCPRAEDNYFTPDSKIFYYEQIIAENKIAPQEAIVFGDRFKVDIEPMLNLGGSGILIQNISDLDSALNNLLNLK